MSKTAGLANTKKNNGKRPETYLKSSTNLVNTGKVVSTKQRPYQAKTRPSSNQKKSDPVTPL